MFGNKKRKMMEEIDIGGAGENQQRLSSLLELLMQSFKLTSLTVAVCGALASACVSAEQYGQLIGPNITGQDEIIVGTPQSPITQVPAVFVNGGYPSGVLDTNEGGVISIYANNYAVSLGVSAKSLTIGSEKKQII